MLESGAYNQVVPTHICHESEMPRFELLSVEEAMAKSATGRRAEVTAEYLGYIKGLGEGQAGRLQATEAETIAADRRRLGAAAKLVGKGLVIKRAGEEICFWVQPGNAPSIRRGRGRPRRATGD